MSSLIFILFSVVAFLGLWLLGKNTGIKLHRHWRSFIFSLLFVSLPLLIVSTIFGLNNLFIFNKTGLIFGLPISLIVILVVLPFAGIYLWGLSKRLISDRAVFRLLPPIVFGIVLAFSIYLLINFNSTASRVSAIMAIVSILILSISKLSYLRRFWFFELLIGGLLLVFNILTTTFGYILNNESIWGFKVGLITIEWLIIYYAFMNIFLAVFYWLDNKVNFNIENKEVDQEKEPSSKEYETSASELDLKKSIETNLDQDNTQSKTFEKNTNNNSSNIANISFSNPLNKSEVEVGSNFDSQQLNKPGISTKMDGTAPNQAPNSDYQHSATSGLNISAQASLQSARQVNNQKNNSSVQLTSNQDNVNGESLSRQNDSNSSTSQTYSNNEKKAKVTERSFNLRTRTYDEQKQSVTKQASNIETQSENISSNNEKTNPTKFKSFIPKVDVKSRLEKLYAARALNRQSAEALNPDFKMPNFSNKPAESGLNLKDKKLEDNKMPEPISLKLDKSSQNTSDKKLTTQNSDKKEKTKIANNQITLKTSNSNNRLSNKIDLSNFSRKTKLTNFKIKANKDGKLSVYSPEADASSSAIYKSSALTNIPNDLAAENKPNTISPQDRLIV